MSGPKSCRLLPGKRHAPPSFSRRAGARMFGHPGGKSLSRHVGDPVALGRRVLRRGSRLGASSASLVFPVAAIRTSPPSKEGRVCSRSSFRLPLAGASRPTPLAAPFQPRADDGVSRAHALPYSKHLYFVRRPHGRRAGQLEPDLECYLGKAVQGPKPAWLS
jgi:hypothetical protein